VLGRAWVRVREPSGARQTFDGNRGRITPMFQTGQRTGQLGTQMVACSDTRFTVFHQAIHLQTETSLQFIDLTETMRTLVAQSGIEYGMVNIQTRHTTTAVVVNEDEPLLLEDMRRMLTRVVPQHDYYLHNDFAIRTINMTPDESPNGHSHCRALFLNSSVTLNILRGELELGRWQRVFFLELDRARPRTVSIMAMGHTVNRGYDWE
jgi:secondary thiamine-phosphate synthase enzyme